MDVASCLTNAVRARLKYLVTSLLPRSTGVVPTACLMIQLAWMTLGISLNRASRSRWLSGPSHRNLPRHRSRQHSCAA